MPSLSLIQARRASNREEYEKNEITDRVLNIMTNKTKNQPNTHSKLKELTPKQKLQLSKLSLEEYQLMCESMAVKKMMARFLEVPVEKLTSICKSANGEIKKIESSLATLKDKRRAKSSPIKELNPDFLMMKRARPVRERPTRARTTIVDVLNIRDLKLKIGEEIKGNIKYELHEWIIEDKLDRIFLSKNYNAIDYLKKKPYLIDYKSLSANKNPKALELLRAQIAKDPDSIDWKELSKNPIAIPLLMEQLLKEEIPTNKKRIDWEAFCSNPHPETIGILKKKIMEDPDNKEHYIHWSYLSSNTSNEAIKYLSLTENYNNIDWWVLSGNTNPEAIKLLQGFLHTNYANYSKLNWFAICKNENAMAIINTVLQNGDYMKWGAFMSNKNPAAIKIIGKMLIDDPNKIVWAELSSNPSAIAILLANSQKIDLFGYSANTNNTKTQAAIELLKKKINEDNNGDIIHWNKLSANTSIFKISLG